MRPMAWKPEATLEATRSSSVASSAAGPRQPLAGPALEAARTDGERRGEGVGDEQEHVAAVHSGQLGELEPRTAPASPLRAAQEENR